MITILALRNPEPEYAGTRHNVGADVVRAFAERNNFSSFAHDKYLHAEASYGTIDGKEVQLLLSDTFMNESGRVIAAGDFTPGDLIVVHDDLAFAVGALKISFGSGAGGHNGIVSVTQALGTPEYLRLRIGIHPLPPRQVSGDARVNFVLKPFTPDEREMLTTEMPRFAEALTTIIAEGREAAMLKYHTEESKPIDCVD